MKSGLGARKSRKIKGRGLSGANMKSKVGARNSWKIKGRGLSGEARLGPASFETQPASAMQRSRKIKGRGFVG